MTEQVTWKCNVCGFEVPAFDFVGKALMQEHRREHDAESPPPSRGSLNE